MHEAHDKNEAKPNVLQELEKSLRIEQKSIEHPECRVSPA